MKWNINDIPVFTAVVAKKGISAAAKHLNMPKSTVSRAVSRLESDLGVRLIDRNSRQLRITAEGEDFYKHGMLINEQIAAAQDRISGFKTEPNGPLSVCFPVAFSRDIIKGELAEFHRRYPQIELDIRVSNEHLDLISEGIDVAIQLGPLPDSEMVSTTLCKTQLIWVTNPGYLAEHPEIQNFNNALAHVRISDKRYQAMHFTLKHQRHRTALVLDSPMHSSDPLMVREMIVAGTGVGLIPDIYCQKALSSGELVRIHQDYLVNPITTIVAVYPSRRLMSEKARLFIDFLRELVHRYDLHQ